MSNKTTSELLEPKNQAFYVAILAGGPADMYRWTRKRLRGEGIDLVIHWDPDGRVTSVPGHVDFVLFFKEFAGKIEPQVMNAARRAGVPVIRTIRKWATMREDLQRHNVLGMCTALPDEGEPEVPAPPDVEPDGPEQEEQAITAARQRAEAAQSKADAERRRADDERAAAAERATRFVERQKAMGIVLPAVPPLLAAREAELRRQEEADAEMAALALATEGDDDDDAAPDAARGGARRAQEEDPMLKVKGVSSNGAGVRDAAAGAGAPAGVLQVLTTHLRAMRDNELVAAVPVATLARMVRELGDEALLAAAEGYAAKALESALARPRRERSPSPAAAAPEPDAPAPARPSGREAPQRERVYRALASLAGKGACRVEQIREHLQSDGNAVNSCLRVLREEGRAFQAGWATNSRWALTQEAADNAVAEAAARSPRRA